MKSLLYIDSTSHCISHTTNKNLMFNLRTFLSVTCKFEITSDEDIFAIYTNILSIYTWRTIHNNAVGGEISEDDK